MADELTIPDEKPLARARRRWESLKSERSPFEAHWRDLSEFLLPRRSRWAMGDDKKDPRSTRIINSTPTLALRTLASGMMAGLTSPARPWFRLTTPDPAMAEFGSVKEWLHQVAQRMRDMFSKTNLYTVLPNIYLEQGGFGTAAIAALEDAESVLRFNALTIGSYWGACDARGRPDTLYRRIEMTVRQMGMEFGTDKLSDSTKAAIRAGQLEAKREVLHVLERNADYDPTMFMTPKGKAWRSCYYECGKADDEQAALREEGFNEFPAMLPRWDVTAAEEFYGSSPGMVALGDVKALQWQERRKAAAIDKHVDPPMVAHPMLRNSKASLLPGEVTYVDPMAGGAGFTPAYAIKPEIQMLMLDIQGMEQRVKRAFFEDLFLMISMGDQRDMTATEIAERHEEKLLALGPVLERQNDDLLDPLIDRAFNVMSRRGLLPAPPKELEGVELRVEYISVLAQAQRAVATGGIERFSGFVANLAGAKPDVLDKVDVDQMVDEYGEALGVPPKIIVPDEQVAKVRAAREKQQQMMQMAAAAPAMKDGMDAAATAATTVPQDGSIMDKIGGALPAITSAAAAAQ